jgi:hypothetical protein
MVAAATDQLPAALSGTLAPAKSVPALLTVADALLHTMGSADLSLDIDDVYLALMMWGGRILMTAPNPLPL